MSEKNAPHIEFRNVKKRFPGQYALKDISFQVKKGEIHSLLGENGGREIDSAEYIARRFYSDFRRSAY